MTAPVEPMKKWNPAWVSREITEWAVNGCSNPPTQQIKTLTLAHLIALSGVKRFIETGTLAGNTSGIMSLIPGVAVDTIELSEHYFHKAKERLSHHRNVTQHLGDSADVLPRLLSDLKEPALFWLDAHYSGGMTAQAEKDTPINEELEAIIRHPVAGHIVVIDDMRGFKGTNDYPATEILQSHLERAKPDYEFLLRNDLGIFAPKALLKAWSENPFKLKQSPIVEA